MSDIEDAKKFLNDINNRINYYRMEYQLTYAEVIGCLRLLIDNLSEECRRKENE